MEGQCKTEYLNRFLQTALGRNATTMFILHQVATHRPVTEQFAPHAFVSCKVWGYGWMGVVDA